MQDPNENLSVALVAEILAVDQMTRALLDRGLPKGMELSQFMVLNLLARVGKEATPAQIADRFHVTRGAMTNTLSRLEAAGHIHIRPDWDDARRKQVSISRSGRTARDTALSAMTPGISAIVGQIGPDRIKTAISILREIRDHIGEHPAD